MLEKIDCLMITTNIPSRQALQERAVQSVEDTSEGLFNQKIMSVDVMEGIPFLITTEPWISYIKLGWKVVSGPCSGHRAMANNQLRGLEHVKSDYLLYCEDHMKVDCLPKSPEDYIACLNTPIAGSGKKIGYACFNSHIMEENLEGVDESVVNLPKDENGLRIKYINCPSNYVCIRGNWFLIKGAAILDEYYLNFPVCMIRSIDFSDMLTYAMANYSGCGIEVGFTKAWHDIGLNRRYEVSAYTQLDPYKDMPITFQSFHDKGTCRYRNNDKESWHNSVSKHTDLPKAQDHWNHFF